MLFEQSEDFRTFIFLKDRRVVQKNKLFLRWCGFQRRFKPPDLAEHYFFIVLPAFLLFVEPAARAAEAVFAVLKGVVIQYLDACYVAFGEELLRLRRR